MIISIAKRIKTEQKKFIFPKFVLFSQNNNDLDISILTPIWQQKLVYWKSILKYSNDSIKKEAGDDSLGDNLFGNDLLDNNNPTHINSDINMDTKTKLNPNKDTTGNNLL